MNAMGALAKFGSVLLCAVLACCGKPPASTVDGAGDDGDRQQVPDSRDPGPPEDGSVVIDIGDGAAESPDAATPAPTADEQLCLDACAVGAQIMCRDRRAGCVQACVMSLSGDPPCGPEIRALAVCQIAAGPSALTCDAVAGATVFKPGYCQQESDAYIACFRRQ